MRTCPDSQKTCSENAKIREMLLFSEYSGTTALRVHVYSAQKVTTLQKKSSRQSVVK
jgi:hypothetical protein